MKGGIRVAAITSGPVRSGREALVVCMVARDGVIEGALSTRVTSDGSDSTRRITSMIRRSRFRDQVGLVALNGIAIAGLNVVDVRSVAKSLGADFVVLTRRRPRKTLLLSALRRLSRQTGADTKARMAVVEAMSTLGFSRLDGFFVQSDVNVPQGMARLAFEALRVSHLVARGVSTGESKGRL